MDLHPSVLISNFNVNSGLSKISGGCADESENKITNKKAKLILGGIACW